MLIGVSVFSLGNNAYGQCGRPIVEGEDFRSVWSENWVVKERTSGQFGQNTG